MGENGLSYLDTAQLILVHLADHVSGVKLDSIDEFDGIISAVDALDHEAVSVLRQLAGMVKEVVALRHGSAHRLDSGCALAVKLYGCRRS